MCHDYMLTFFLVGKNCFHFFESIRERYEGLIRLLQAKLILCVA